MPGCPSVGRFTFSGLTVAPASGYTGYIGSRERITPMNEDKSIAAAEYVAAGLHETLVAEFRSPMGGVEMDYLRFGEDFNRILLTTPAGRLFITVTSAAGEEDADVRVVVLDAEILEDGVPHCEAHAREVGRVARAVSAIPGVGGVWSDMGWARTFLASVHSEGADS